MFVAYRTLTKIYLKEGIVYAHFCVGETPFAMSRSLPLSIPPHLLECASRSLIKLKVGLVSLSSLMPQFYFLKEDFSTYMSLALVTLSFKQIDHIHAPTTCVVIHMLETCVVS